MDNMISNEPDVSPNGLSCVNLDHRSMLEPIDDDHRCVAAAVASLVLNLPSVVADRRATSVLLAMNSYDAYESFVDHMDLTRVVVAIFDAYSHRCVYQALAFELNRMVIVWTMTMTIQTMMMTMMVLKYCHGSNVKWVAHFSIVLVIVKYCA